MTGNQREKKPASRAGFLCRGRKNYFFIVSAGVGAGAAASLAGSSFAASGAGAGAGAGVAAGAGAGAGCLGAGAGFSPQAVKPTANKAAIRNERFMVFPLT
jgi:hypothetical protein